MNKVTSYLKNVGKSVSYATVDVVTKKMIPEVVEFTDTNKELFKAVYSTVYHSKQSIAYGKKLAKDSQIYKDINKGIDNVLSDIKTGNFYNKERTLAANDAAADDWMGGSEDFGDLGDFGFDDDDWDMDSFDDDDSSSSSIDKGDVLVADSIAKSSNATAQLISRTVANTSNNIIKTTMATTNMTMAQNVELIAGVRTSIAGVHESINRFFKFAQDNVPTQINNQSQFFTDSINIMKENNAILKEMLEMQRNVYKQQAEEAKSKDQYADVAISGIPDFTEYFKAIKKNVINLDKSGTVNSLLADTGGASMLSHMLSNPLGGLMTGLVSQYIPKNLAKQIASFSKSLGNIFPTMIARLNKWKKDGVGGWREILGSIFGLSTETKTSVDTSKYNKGAVPFDGITRKSIIEVIPGYLSRIESLLSGTSQRIYDFHDGKWMTAKEIQKKKDAEYRRAVTGGFSDLEDDIKSAIRSLEKKKVLDSKKKKSLEKDIYSWMEKTFKDGGWTSFEDIKKNSENYKFEDTDLMMAFMNILSTNMPLSKWSSVAANTFDSSRSYAQKQRDYETGGDSIINQLYNNAKNDSHLKYNKDYEDIVEGVKSSFNILEIKDDSGKNMLNYLKDILMNVSFIREYGISGGYSRPKTTDRRTQIGSGIKYYGSSVNFDDYMKKFDTAYEDPELIKAKEKKAKEDEKYDKSNYNESKNFEEELISILYDEKKKDKRSDLDEDDFEKFGKKYKEFNKWQKAKNSIAGESFKEKWKNAESFSDRQNLIMGSLSDIAKSPVSLLDKMITRAEASLYTFLFSAETDEIDEEGNKIKGFFNATLNKMRAAWDRLTVNIDEKLITPLTKKFGLDDKWNNFKQKVKDSKPMEMIRNAKDKLKSAIGADLRSGFDYVADVVVDGGSKETNINNFLQKITNDNNRMLEGDIENIIVNDGSKFLKNKISVSEYLDYYNSLNSEKISKNQIYKMLKSGELSGTKDNKKWVIDNPFVSDKVKNTLKEKLGDEEYQRLKEKIGFAKPGVGNVEESGSIEVSKGESVAVLGSDASEEELNAVIESLINLLNGKVDRLNKGRARVNRLESKKESSVDLYSAMKNEVKGIPGFIAKVLGIKGKTTKEQEENIEKDQKKLLDTAGNVLSEMKGEGYATASKAILGGGVGLLTGVVGGPLLGAGLGVAYSLNKNSKTVNEVLFGKDRKYDENGMLEEKEGGLISKEIQNTYKKYFPDMGKFGVLGAVSSLVLPFGPLAGAAIGAGIGLAKNSESMNEIIFGEEDGLLNEERRENLKKYLPKAAAGAAVGLVAGPFGMLGNAVLGSGIGMLTGTEKFKELIFGEDIGNGERVGGLKQSLNEHFVEPLKNFGTNFKDDFFGFIKESMIKPLNDAIVPITAELGFIAKRIGKDFPKWLLSLGRDHIGRPILATVNQTIISPIAGLVKKLFGGIMSKVKGAISLPFRAVGGLGNVLRKHQIKVGRDQKGTARSRLQFAHDKGLGDYGYRALDEDLLELSENGKTEELTELTAKAGLLAQGSEYFNKEVKKARRTVEKVLKDYVSLNLLSKDSGTYSRIVDYLNNNEIDAAIEELTNVMQSRKTGGPIDSELDVAVSRLSDANRKYQVARQARDNFAGDEEKIRAELEAKYGKGIDASRVFEYARKELAKAGGQKIGKTDIFKRPEDIITKGESEIKTVLDKIYKFISNKDSFDTEEQNEEYENKVASGTTAARMTIYARKSFVQNDLSMRNFKFSKDDEADVVNLLYQNPKVHEVVLSASKQGLNYDANSIRTLASIKLTSEQVRILKRYPYVGTLPARELKKNLNYIRNDHGRFFGFNARRLQNIQLETLSDAIKAGNDENNITSVSEDGKFHYVNTEYGPRRYIKDEKGELQLDLADSETKESIDKENHAKAEKKSLYGAITGIKDGIFGIFNRDKEKDKEEKKVPWYKKLFDSEIGDGLGSKIKFGLAIAGGFTALGALHRLWENREPGGVIDNIGTSIKEKTGPIFEKITNWLAGDGEFEGKGLPGFMEKHIFPNLFDGMNVFFGRIVPAVVSAFVKNLPMIIKSAVKGALSWFKFGDRDKGAGDLDASTASASSSNVSSTKGRSSASWMKNLESDANATASSIAGIKVDKNGNISNNAANDVIKGAANTSPSSQFNIDGVNMYTKNENGELVPITNEEYANGQYDTIYNQYGQDYIYNEETGSYQPVNPDGSDTVGQDIAKRAGSVIGRSALTGRVAGIDMIQKGINATTKVTQKIPGLNLISRGFRASTNAVTKPFSAASKAVAYASNSFTDMMHGKVAGSPTMKNVAGGPKMKTKASAAAAADNIGKVSNKTKKANKGFVSKTLNKVLEYGKNTLKRILNSNKVTAKIAEGIAESGSKKTVKQVIKELIDKLTGAIAKKLTRMDTSVITKIATKISSQVAKKAFFIAFLVADFITGFDKAESILQIKEAGIVQKFLAGLANAICNFIFFGFIKTSDVIDVIVDFVFPIFDINTSEFKKQQEEAQAEVDEYNKQHGTEFSVEDYLEQTESNIGKFKNLFKTKNKVQKDKKDPLTSMDPSVISTDKMAELTTGNIGIQQLDYYKTTQENIQKANEINDLKLGYLYGFNKNGKPVPLSKGVKGFKANQLKSKNNGLYTVSDLMNDGSTAIKNVASEVSTETDKKKGFWETIKGWFKGSGINGKGSGKDNGFVSQVDPKYSNIRFNISGDTERQTIADSGCAPATAANIINLYSGQGNVMEDASRAALKYKDRNSGVTPDYFENYLGSKGIDTHSTVDKRELVTNINMGRPTVLLGSDPTNRAKTPYGAASSHYVLATGHDGRGNVIIQDPESRRPNALYPMKEVIRQSHLGMVTNRMSGSGRKYNAIKYKINSNVISISGRAKNTIEGRVWKKLRGAGFGEVQVAGVMGNIKHESGFRPDAIEGGSGEGFGICQWSFGRKTNLKNYAKKIGKKATDLDVQIDFLIAEMTPGGGAKGYATFAFNKSSTAYDGKSYTFEKFKKTNDIEYATRAFCFCWERPSEDPNVNHIDSRIKSAKEYYKKYTGTEPDSSSSSSSPDTGDSSSGILGAISNAMLSYYDEKLLKLFGFSSSSDTDTDSSSNSLENENKNLGTGKLGWPSTEMYIVTSEFGSRWGGWHGGIDIACSGSAKGKKIVAADDGKVEIALEGVEGDFNSNGGYGGYVKINHGDGLATLYAHASKVLVKKGDTVKKGDVIAKAGNTGWSYGAHLHFEVQVNGEKKNPRNYIKNPKGEGKGSGKIKSNTIYAGRGTKKNISASSTSPVYAKSKPGNSLPYLPENSSAAKDGLYIIPASGEIVRKKGTKLISQATNKVVSGKGSSNIGRNILSGKGTNLSKLNSTFVNYNTLRERKSGRASGFSLPALSSSTKSTYSTTGSSYNMTTTGSSISVGDSAVEKLLTVIIDVLSIIANNSEKLSEIVTLLSKALDLNLTNNDISSLSSNNAQMKNKIANALKSQGSVNGMGNSIMSSNTESLANAMYSIATA